MKKLEKLKNKEIKNLSNFRGAGATVYPSITERKEGNCVITDAIYYDDNGNETSRKDIATVCTQPTSSIY